MNVARARLLRGDMTDAERLLWHGLRQLKHEGFHFRRQAPIGPFVADFACHSAKIVVELDGDQHGKDANIKRDAIRTAYFRSRGYRVLRFANHEIFRGRDDAVEMILAVAKERVTNPCRA